MSRANIESLLRLQQVQPNVEPIALQPQFLSSEVSGGQIQLGQAQQQIGPTAEMAEAEANLALYVNQLVAIGEHSDLMDEHDKWIEKYTNAKDKLESLNHLFDSQQIIKG